MQFQVEFQTTAFPLSDLADCLSQAVAASIPSSFDLSSMAPFCKEIGNEKKLTALSNHLKRISELRERRFAMGSLHTFLCPTVACLQGGQEEIKGKNKSLTIANSGLDTKQKEVHLSSASA